MRTTVSVILLLSFLCGKGQIVTSIEKTISQIRIEYGKINDAKLNCKQQNLEGESAEGGLIKKFYDNGTLRKTILVFYGETGKSTTEYYFKDNKIIFSYTKEDKYNAPIYAKGGGKISSSKENRYYFGEEKLIRWIGTNNKIVDEKLYQSKEKEIKEDLMTYVFK